MADTPRSRTADDVHADLMRLRGELTRASRAEARRDDLLIEGAQLGLGRAHMAAILGMDAAAVRQVLRRARARGVVIGE